MTVGDIARVVFASAVLVVCFLYLCRWLMPKPPRSRTEVQPAPDARTSMFLLEHRGETYPCRDLFEAVEVTRYLTQIERLPETTDAA